MQNQQVRNFITVGLCLLVFLSACATFATHTVNANTQAPTHPRVVSVCTETGLTGPAQQENLLFCNTNGINGVVTNCCGSVYHQSIDLARKKHIIVGTPT